LRQVWSDEPPSLPSRAKREVATITAAFAVVVGRLERPTASKSADRGYEDKRERASRFGSHKGFRMKTTKQLKREAKQLFRLCLVDGMLDETRAWRVVQRVLASRRRGYLFLAAHFERLVKLERSRHTAQVESATPLPDDLQASVQAGLVRVYGPRIVTSFAHSPALIGGMRIKVGSDVYDGSVKAGLAELEKSF
jgi:F-type H+-transporting ATPase subunit delta